MMPTLAVQKIRYAAATHKGYVRVSNEDALFVADTIVKGENVVRSGEISDASLPIFMIADGMGGHARGDVASSVALEFLKEDLEFSKASTWHDRIARANDELFDLMLRQPELRGMGTTLVGVEVGRSDVSMFNVGDSRGYLLVNEELTMVTTDDVPDRTGRTSRSHEITQSLGGRLTRNQINPHIRRLVPLNVGDKLLLCSDGLSDMISEQDICRILVENADVDLAVATLLEAALRAGGTDNVTLICLCLEKN